MRERSGSAMRMLMIGVLLVAGPGCEVEDDISSLEYACANGIIQNLVDGDAAKNLKEFTNEKGYAEIALAPDSVGLLDFDKRRVGLPKLMAALENKLISENVNFQGLNNRLLVMELHRFDKLHAGSRNDIKVLLALEPYASIDERGYIFSVNSTGEVERLYKTPETPYVLLTVNMDLIITNAIKRLNIDNGASYSTNTPTGMANAPINSEIRFESAELPEEIIYDSPNFDRNADNSIFTLNSIQFKKFPSFFKIRAYFLVYGYVWYDGKPNAVYLKSVYPPYHYRTGERYNPNLQLITARSDSDLGRYGITVVVMNCNTTWGSSPVVDYITKRIRSYAQSEITSYLSSLVPYSGVISIPVIGQIPILGTLISKIFSAIFDSDPPQDSVIASFPLIDPIYLTYISQEKTVTISSQKYLQNASIKFHRTDGYPPRPSEYTLYGQLSRLSHRKTNKEFPPGCEDYTSHFDVTLNWNYDGTDKDLIQYEIWRKSSWQTTFEQIATVNVNTMTYKDTRVIDDHFPYTYKIRAVKGRAYFFKETDPRIVNMQGTIEIDPVENNEPDNPPILL